MTRVIVIVVLAGLLAVAICVMQERQAKKNASMDCVMTGLAPDQGGDAELEARAGMYEKLLQHREFIGR